MSCWRQWERIIIIREKYVRHLRERERVIKLEHTILSMEGSKHEVSLMSRHHMIAIDIITVYSHALPHTCHLQVPH